VFDRKTDKQAEKQTSCRKGENIDGHMQWKSHTYKEMNGKRQNKWPTREKQKWIRKVSKNMSTWKVYTYKEEVFNCEQKKKEKEQMDE
jgi:hypothetical protein